MLIPTRRAWKKASLFIVVCVVFVSYIHFSPSPADLARVLSRGGSFSKFRKPYYTHPLFSQQQSTDADDAPISWIMHPVDKDQLTYTEMYNGNYNCRVKPNERVDLDPSIKPKVWFRTDIQTSLNILVMGDSVAMQIGELLQEAIGIPESQRLMLRPLYPQCVGPIVASDCSHTDGNHESLFWGRSPQGGGAGGWRIVNWWLRRNAGKPLPEAFGGGWDANDSKNILKSIKNFAPKDTYSKTNRPKIDVLVFRVSQPWMDWEEMTPTNMHKTIQVAREQLGVRIVVFVTIPFANNIVDENDIEQMHATNDMIRDFARNYPKSPDRLKDMTVVTWDLAQLNNILVQENAQQMGYQIRDRYDFEFALNVLLPKKTKKPGKKLSHTKSIGHVCTGPIVPHHSKDCIYNNMITYDGQHLCLSTFGGRMMAGLACVIRCATTYGADNTTDAEETENGDRPLSLHECEDACNEEYMSLNELDVTMFAKNTS